MQCFAMLALAKMQCAMSKKLTLQPVLYSEHCNRTSTTLTRLSISYAYRTYRGVSYCTVCDIAPLTGTYHIRWQVKYNPNGCSSIVAGVTVCVQCLSLCTCDYDTRVWNAHHQDHRRTCNNEQDGTIMHVVDRVVVVVDCVVISTAQTCLWYFTNHKMIL
jgi:hypothetical protein